MILAELELAGQNIRKAYQKRSFSDPSKDYYFIHRDTGNTEPVIIEYGFLDSKSDDITQLKYDYKKYAEAVAKAVAKYVGIEVNSDNYIVKAGDTLWSIAKSNNMTVDELKQINNLKTNLLSIGQELIVKKPEIETSNKNIYIVEKGDTLYSIGRKYNISVNKIIEDNNLSTTKLSIGQKLYINDNLYTVKAGDTLYSIARKYNTTVENLMKINNLSTTVLSIGQILKI